MVELAIDEGLLASNPLKRAREFPGELVELRLCVRELRLDHLLVASSLLQVRPPLLGVIRRGNLQLGCNPLDLEEPLLGIDIGFQDLVVTVAIACSLLEVVFLVHEVLVFALVRHFVLSDGVDLSIAIHLSLVSEALVWMGRHPPLKLSPSEDLLQQAVKHQANTVPVALLELTWDDVDLDAHCLHRNHHVGNDGIRIVILIPVRLLFGQLK
mmetsp:Transcript_8050/g.17474  ORF Transcript_8050/g.17474 Transcript_8050/m.17474 type:complete len:212 (+) Transcript_8050:515-1150(+)